MAAGRSGAWSQQLAKHGASPGARAEFPLRSAAFLKSFWNLPKCPRTFKTIGSGAVCQPPTPATLWSAACSPSTWGQGAFLPEKRALSATLGKGLAGAVRLCGPLCCHPFGLWDPAHWLCQTPQSQLLGHAGLFGALS